MLIFRLLIYMYSVQHSLNYMQLLIFMQLNTTQHWLVQVFPKFKGLKYDLDFDDIWVRYWLDMLLDTSNTLFIFNSYHLLSIRCQQSFRLLYDSYSYDILDEFYLDTVLAKVKMGGKIFVQRLRSKPWTYKSKLFLSVFLSVFLFFILYPIFQASNWLRPWFLGVFLAYRLIRTLNPAN